MDFYVGADLQWLGRAGYPLMVSHGRLRRAKRLPRAIAPWVCDSRGFTELQQNGRWTITPEQYVADLRRYRDEIGMLRWASPQDWMCEPIVISGGTAGGVAFAGTGLSVLEHQRRTVANFLELRALAPDLPVIPALQGWTIPDYLRCVDMYADAGVDLRAEPVVGLGSTCRREATGEVFALVRELTGLGIRLHGYGAKTGGLALYGHLLASADSFAWSYGARKRGGACRHGAGIKWETNCPDWAREWRGKILDSLAA